MPHGPLTPLGRHFRSVLANLSRPPRSTTPNAALHHPVPLAAPDRYALRPPLRHLHTTAVNCASADSAASYTPITPIDCAEEPTKPIAVKCASASNAASYTPIDPAEGTTNPAQHGSRFRTLSRNALNRQTRVDHLTAALKDAGIRNVVPYVPVGKKRIDLSYMNPQSRDGFKNYQRTRQRRLERNPVPAPLNSREISLQKLTASLIRHRAKASDPLNVAWNTRFELSPIENDFLQLKGVTLDDLSTWADILSDQDSLHAAQLLARRADDHGPASIPKWVHLYILRRPHISATALRILVHRTLNLFEHFQNVPIRSGLRRDKLSILVAVVRLLRHAREVLPQAMHIIVDMVLRHYEHQRDLYGENIREKTLDSVVFFLNKVMSLVSLSTAHKPFKNLPYQEAAIVSILQYMAQHDPPLPITRTGYRAVVRIQLAQRKTHSEQRWAGLQKLSWPPWKEDRTAIDALITADEHGVSRAAATLNRMREAGYAFQDWENAAMLYAGWDTDQTPTIQLRTLLGSSLPRRFLGDGDEQPWAARIESTRTVQEAWACYLSWEDAKLRPDQRVYLAIMTKLGEEKKRLTNNHPAHESLLPGGEDRWPLFPGDVREISPLPPSTHLETYTPTQPPSLEGFYERMAARGVVFEGSRLAYLLEQASSREFVVKLIRDNIPAEKLSQIDSPYHASELPQPVLVALLQALVNFTRSIPWSQWSQMGLRTSLPQRPVPIEAFDPSIMEGSGLYLDPNNSLTIALNILRNQPVVSRAAFNVLLHALHKRTRRRVLIDSRGGLGPKRAFYIKMPREWNTLVANLTQPLLAQAVVNIMHARGMDADTDSFYGLSLATLRLAKKVWSVLEYHDVDNCIPDGEVTRARGQALALIRDKDRHMGIVKREFDILVGEDGSAPAALATTEMIPLTVPDPAVLHAYIRCLGWWGDYAGLVTLLEWMRAHQAELVERASQDRNGRDVSRRNIVAVRVFLERSWVGERSEESDKGDEGSEVLALLRSPADGEVVEKARAAVEGWGDVWASEEEVEEYVEDMMKN